MLAVMAKRCVAGRLPLLLVYPPGGVGSPSDGGGKCDLPMGWVLLRMGAGRGGAALGDMDAISGRDL